MLKDGNLSLSRSYLSRLTPNESGSTWSVEQIRWGQRFGPWSVVGWGQGTKTRFQLWEELGGLKYELKKKKKNYYLFIINKSSTNEIFKTTFLNRLQWNHLLKIGFNVILSFGNHLWFLSNQWVLQIKLKLWLWFHYMSIRFLTGWLGIIAQ